VSKTQNEIQGKLEQCCDKSRLHAIFKRKFDEVMQVGCLTVAGNFSGTVKILKESMRIIQVSMNQLAGKKHRFLRALSCLNSVLCC
jgi:hypothetical protein